MSRRRTLNVGVSYMAVTLGRDMSRRSSLNVGVAVVGPGYVS